MISVFRCSQVIFTFRSGHETERAPSTGACRGTHRTGRSSTPSSRRSDARVSFSESVQTKTKVAVPELLMLTVANKRASLTDADTDARTIDVILDSVLPCCFCSLPASLNLPAVCAGQLAPTHPLLCACNKRKAETQQAAAAAPSRAAAAPLRQTPLSTLQIDK